MSQKNGCLGRFKKLFFCIIFCLSAQVNANGAAWLQKAKQVEIINNIGINQNNLFLNSPIVSTSGLYEFYYNLYIEYGLHKRITVGANLMAILSNLIVHTPDGIAHYATFGMPVIEIFARVSLVEYKGFILSVETINATPSPYKHNTLGEELYIGKQYNALQFQVNIGYSDSDQRTGIWGADGTKGFFISGSLAYRYNTSGGTGYNYSQIRLLATLGVHLTSNFTIILDLTKILSINLNEGGTTMIGSYHVLKSTLYFVAKVGEQTSLVFGIMLDFIDIKTISNPTKNPIGQGGVLFGVWQRF